MALSTKGGLMSYFKPLDDEFAEFANSLDTQFVSSNSNKRISGTSHKGDFEELVWTGLVLKKPLIIRAIGGVPNTGKEPGTAITRRIAWIRGDSGRKVRVIFPERDSSPGHILWRIITAVNEVAYVNRRKTFVHETKNPEIFFLVNKNGLKPNNPQYIYDNGWIGKTKFLMNCIDREKMDWHRENKHTLLLSKSVNVTPDNKVYAEEGVPAYGFLNLLTTGIFKYYKDWRKYDLAITRLGLKETPFRIINATKYIEEIPDHLKPFVSHDPWLTEEEQSWAVYDLRKIFDYTSMTKIYNNLKGNISLIDQKLGTRFLKDLESLVEEEQDKKSQKDIGVDVPVRRRVSVSGGIPNKETHNSGTYKVRERAPSSLEELVPYWSKLTPKEQSMIKKVVLVEGSNKIETIEYDTDEELVGCPKCGTVSPVSFSTCPGCGESFDFF